MKSREEPQIVCELKDSKVGLNAYLVIDSTGPNGACGGIRIRHDLTLKEVIALARSMTLKKSSIAASARIMRGASGRCNLTMPRWREVGRFELSGLRRDGMDAMVKRWHDDKVGWPFLLFTETRSMFPP